jgi:hypothetical protein
MRQTIHRSKLWHILIILVLILFGFTITPQATLAQTIVRGDSLLSGEVIENDVVMFGDDVQLSGTVVGNAFITGQNITIDGTVEGSLFAIGQRITINGSVDGSAYLTSLTARLGSTGSVGQNLYFIGVSISTESGSQIGRDLNGVSLGAYLQGSVGRETSLIAGLIQFLGMFMDTTLGPAPGPLQVATLSNRAPGLGQFLLPGDYVIDILGQASTPEQESQPVQTQGELVAEWFLDRLRDLLPLLTIGLISYWLLRKRLEAASSALKARPLPALGIGLIGLFIAGSVIAAFILVYILILMLGIWLGTITLWNMAWLLWTVAFPFVSLVFALFMIFLNYGTKAIVVYAGTTWITNRFMPQAERYRLIFFVLGLIIFILLRAIPILGWIISIVVTAWGLGAAWLAWRSRNAANQPELIAMANPVDEPVLGPPDLSKLEE